MSTIDDLKNKVQRLKDQLREAEKSLHAAMVEEHPVKIGMVFQDSKGRRGQVTHVFVKWGTIKVTLSLFRKDGTLGERTADLAWGGWKIVDGDTP